LEPKQIFALVACLGAYSPKSKIHMTLVFLLTTVIDPVEHIKEIKNRFVGSYSFLKLKIEKNAKLHYNR